jgi:hydroxyethylthiazole kinase
MPAEGVDRDLECSFRFRPIAHALPQGSMMQNDFNTDLRLAAMLQVMRNERPLVQCITNFVAMNIAANVMLAAGSSPAMVHAREESGDFARISKAVTINIGTLSPTWVDGMRTAAKAAKTSSIPWVFDPVAHYATAYRGQVALELLALRPDIIRGNASEIIALNGLSAHGSGVDNGDGISHAVEPAKILAKHHGCVVAVTGQRDFITDGTRSVWIEGGSSIMPQITALGCSLTCLVGAFAGCHPDAFEASIAALSLFGVCGELAEKQSSGPGSFQPAFLDQLSLIHPEQFQQLARISPA